ncbi:hypothetical protein [Treponema sp. OMZ 855]|uniref:hypothetical protein n=1 Tax=Treponema sp. OMZ 855 TaxID=1643512 RepID=UPI0020A3B3CB|nr:hypothetical protein [Treponema sp. OMZ 855]UTC49812.1 hypothetical protein E4N65_06760 [Treponema sp. OMZ 855]
MTLSLLVSLLVVALGLWICFTFVYKYAAEEACETISELKDEDRKKLVEDIVSYNKFIDRFAFGLARVDTNKYPDLFSATEINSTETTKRPQNNSDQRHYIALYFAIITITVNFIFIKNYRHVNLRYLIIINMIYLVSDLMFFIFCQ